MLGQCHSVHRQLVATQRWARADMKQRAHVQPTALAQWVKYTKSQHISPALSMALSAIFCSITLIYGQLPFISALSNPLSYPPSSLNPPLVRLPFAYGAWYTSLAQILHHTTQSAVWIHYLKDI